VGSSHDVFTAQRWERLWHDSEIAYDPAAEPQLRDSLALIRRFWPEGRVVFLEAGCGPAANALNLAREGMEIVGVDLSSSAVEAAEAAFAARGLNGRFLLGDVRDLPLPDRSVDFVYAGGVVEHFREIDRALAEMVRVLRPGGRLLITVPALTLSYPYLFLRGNVPALPVAEQALAAVHFRLLRGKLATFGYERSFTRRRLHRLLISSGLTGVEVGRFDTFLPLAQVPRSLRGPARRLARMNAFAPMWYGVGSCAR
jgi:SAM-dependent methyltransferase